MKLFFTELAFTAGSNRKGAMESRQITRVLDCKEQDTDGNLSNEPRRTAMKISVCPEILPSLALERTIYRDVGPQATHADTRILSLLYYPGHWARFGQ